MPSYADFCEYISERWAPLEGKVEMHCPLDDPNTVELYSIDARPTRCGYGSIALSLICDAADATGFDIFLGVKNEEVHHHKEGDPLEADLVRWYSRYGFVEKQRSGGGVLTMIRKFNADVL